MDLPEFLTVADFAKECKVTPQAVRKAIKDGRIFAQKIGHIWAIPSFVLINKRKRLQSEMC
jgi:hypothetical protein